MKPNELQRLINNLSWDMPEEVQLSAIENLNEIDDESTPLLIQDDGKHCWENAVKVLENISYPRNKLAIPRLIWLMQDMNWPGVAIAIEVIKSIDKSVLIPYIEDALIKAVKDEDFMWIGGIQRSIDTLKISETDFNHKEVYQFLKLADW